MRAAAMAEEEGSRHRRETRVGDLPEACLAHAIALTSPRCAAVSPAFRAAADSDHVWGRFIPEDHRRAPVALRPAAAAAGRADTKKDAYVGLCDGGVPVGGDGGGRRLWLDRASGAKCYALSARRLGLPWEDGEFSWRWVPHPLSRFGEVAELMDCTFLDIYGRLPAYAAYLVYGTAQGHRGPELPGPGDGGEVGRPRAVVGGPGVPPRRVPPPRRGRGAQVLERRRRRP